ncbi:MAG: efflux RND transporter permease subunit [Bacteroidales bacterium]|nr:efflux RND transporter permease subunit [Bacteroidales bacterium]
MQDKIKDTGVIRDFKLTSLALKNKTTVFLLSVILLVFGIYSYVKLPKELFPDIMIPTVMVNTIYPGNPPVDIENLITRPLEKEIESVKGIKKLSSTSAQGMSYIFVEFNTNVDIDNALQDVKDAVDKSRGELPNDLDFDPVVMDIDFSEFPIVNINLSGDYSVNELKDYAEFLEEQIETVYEVSKVEITGINDREFQINVLQHKLDAYQLSFGDIENAIMSENLNISGGEIKLGNSRRSVRVIGEFTKIEDIGDIIVKHEKGNIVYLHDVAEVKYGFEEPDSFARLNKQSVVSLQVVKKGGENLLTATKKIFKILEEAKEVGDIPQDLNITISNDQSDEVRKQLSNLENSIIMGVIFVVLVLFFFLGTRNALFVGLAIPSSMFLSFMVMGIMGTQINMIVLFSLILALGMLVDNAIVVVENIYRFYMLGYERTEAARLAVGEIAMPIISSTLTTLAAFFPLLFWDDIMGEFMKYLPETLIIVLTSSLFVALVIIPVVSAAFVKDSGGKELEHKRGAILSASGLLIFGLLLYLPGWNIIGGVFVILGIIGFSHILFLNRLSYWFQNTFLVKLEGLYLRFLKFALRKRNPYMFIAGTIALLIFTMVFMKYRDINVVFFPTSDPKYINVIAEFPIGTDIQQTNTSMIEIENDVFAILDPYSDITKSVLTNVGKGAVGENEGFTGGGGQPHKGLITVSFIDFQFRNGVSTSKILKELGDGLIGEYPGVQVSVEKQNEGPPTGKPINIELSGKEFEDLLVLSDSVIKAIHDAEIEGIEGLKIDLDIGKPELLFTIDRDKARRYGVSTYQIASTVRTALFGKEISDFKVGEDEYPIQLRMKEDYRNNLSSLLNQKITFRSQSSGQIIQVPVSSVAEVKYTSTYGSVIRKDRRRVVTVYSNVLEGYNATRVNEQIKPVLDKLSFPKGYKYEMTGEQEEQQKSMAFLLKALLIAVSVITLILVTQFNSIVKPAIIMFSVILSTIGVFGGLATFRMDFVVIMTGIGIVSLAGVVVNNAIVLIDYINLLKVRRRDELNMPHDGILSLEESIYCIVEGGKTRLRPVLLTAITTILGLIPLATGINIDFVSLLENFDPNFYMGGDNVAFWGPISWTVIFGLSFATFLTLVIVPCMYHVLYLVKVYFLKKI